MTLGDKQVLDFKLGHNDILAAANTFGCALLVPRDQRGTSEPIPVYMEHTVPPSLQRRFESTPLPRRDERSAPASVRPIGWRHATPDAARVEAIRATFERIRRDG
jgi:hypothetical protein